jgi:hypothetical protein
MLTKLKIMLFDLRRAIAARINLILLAAFPFAEQIMSVIAANLPAAAAYLPANVYKWVGFAVVVFNIVRDLVKKAQAAPEAAK